MDRFISWTIILVLNFLSLVVICHACSPPDGVFQTPATDAKIHFSDYFAWGKVKKIIRGGYDYDTMYTVEFEIYCTYKGGPLPRFITIVEAGRIESYEPALCMSNDFKKGKEYLIYLDDASEKGKYRPSFTEDSMNTDGEMQLLDDVTLYCEVEQIDYPIGYDRSSAKHECPEPYPDYPDCMKYVETTSEPIKVDVKTMPEEGGEEPKGEKPGYKEETDDKPKTKPEPEPEPVGDGDKGAALKILPSFLLLLACVLVGL